MRAVSQDMLIILIRNISLIIAYLKFHLNFPEANDLPAALVWKHSPPASVYRAPVSVVAESRGPSHSNPLTETSQFILKFPWVVFTINICIGPKQPLNTKALTQWGWHKIADISTDDILWMTNFVLHFEFHWSFIPKSLIDNNLASVQIMAWRRTGTGAKSLSGPMMAYVGEAYMRHSPSMS